MDWDEQEKRALEILKDPGADEQQWLDACNEIGSRKTYPHVALSKLIDWPLALMMSFCSGMASIGGAVMLGGGVVAITLVLSGLSASTSSGMSALLWIVQLSLALGFVFGLCRRTPPKDEAFRAGVMIPIFAATVLANIFCLPALISSLGTWAYNIPFVSLFLTLGAYKLGSSVLNTLITEERRGEESCGAKQLDSSTTRKAIAMARSSAESESQKNETNSDHLRVEPEKLQLDSEILQIEREKVKIEREKLELEREKLQIEVKRMQRKRRD